ncbi:MAG: transporter permease [Acidimicrobiales bacterium]|nr:transporter permease [Acidimicrobiales bacterium]
MASVWSTQAGRHPGRGRRGRGLAIVGLIVAAVVVALGGGSESMMSFATLALIYAIAAAAVDLMKKDVGLISLGHAAVWGAGAYTAALCVTSAGYSPWLAMLAAIVAGAVAAAIMVLPVIRSTGFHFSILTLALNELAVLAVVNGGEVTKGSYGIVVPGLSRLGPINFEGNMLVAGRVLSPTGTYLIFVAVLTAIALLVVAAVRRTAWAQTLHAVRDDALLARSLGTRPEQHIVLVAMASGALAGLSGFLYLNEATAIQPSLFSGQASVLFVLIALLGGSGYLLGPVLGALAAVFLPGLFQLSPEVQQMAYGGALVLVAIAFSGGMASGVERVWNQLRPRSAPSAPARPWRLPERAASGGTDGR